MADEPVIDDLLDEENEEQQELYEHYGFKIDKGQSQLRIDKFLTQKIEGVSRNRIQNAADAGNILVNGVAVKSNYKVKPLDQVSIVMPYPPRDTEIIPENIPLNIIYEDDQLLVVNKPAGMVVHPGHGNWNGTLVNALVYHFKDLPTHRNGEVRPGLVHRIDKNTSGLLVIAKNELAHSMLANQFFNHTSKRTYIALVWGNLAEDAGTITGNVGRCIYDRQKMDVFPDGSQGKHAVTHFRVLERFGYVNLVECTLETGRTHQIRAHFQHIGHPLFNDEKYGGNEIRKGTTFTKYKQFIQNCFKIMPRQALHAKTLGFVHPTTKEELLFDSEITSDMQEVIEKWRVYVATRDTSSEE